MVWRQEGPTLAGKADVVLKANEGCGRWDGYE
jgi:hypothetical protein